MTASAEWQQRLDALQALFTAPFVIFIIVIVISAALVTAAIERSNRS